MHKKNQYSIYYAVIDNIHLVIWLIIDITVIDTFAQFDTITCAMSTVLPINLL